MIIKNLEEIKEVLLCRSGHHAKEELKGYAQKWYGPQAVHLKVLGSMSTEYNDEYYYEQGDRRIFAYDEEGRPLNMIMTAELKAEVEEEMGHLPFHLPEEGEEVDIYDMDENSVLHQFYLIEKEKLPEGKAYWGKGINPYQETLGHIIIESILAPKAIL